METFTHRSGRTGRAGEEGENVVVLCPKDASKFRGMLRRTSVEAEWLKVPDKDEIKRKHRVERQKDFLKETLKEPSEDILDWARNLLEEIDSSRRGGYELKEELEKDIARKNTRKKDMGTFSQKGPKRAVRASCTTVRLGLLPSKDWNVGRVLSGICNALDVSNRDVAKIDIQGDSAKVELMPEALEKYDADSRSLKKWGFIKEGVSGHPGQRAFPGHGKREQRRAVKKSRDKQRTY
jgi:ATP-dependent RNA helicase DeaD